MGTNYPPPGGPGQPPPQGPYGGPPPQGQYPGQQQYPNQYGQPYPGQYPGMPGGPPMKKKTSPWIWVLVGCLGLVLLIVLGVGITGFVVANKLKQAGFDPNEWNRNPASAAAKMMTTFNKDLEVVSVDENLGVLVVREKSTGKRYRFKFDDIRNGRIQIGQGTPDDTVREENEGGSGDPPAQPESPQ